MAPVVKLIVASWETYPAQRLRGMARAVVPGYRLPERVHPL